MKKTNFSSIIDALNDLRAGKIIIVTDDENRENEGDFIAAGVHTTKETINFMATHGRGLICTPITSKIAKRLELPPMVGHNTATLSTAFTISIDAKENITTGISCDDRSHTIKLLTKETTLASDFARPGHIFPLIAKDGGVLERDGHTEASVDLMKLAELPPVATICEILDIDGSAARLPYLTKLAQEFDLKIVSIKDLIEYRKK